MNFAKRLEQANKKLWYSLFKVIFKNREATLPLPTKTIKKILVFRYDAIGDMVVTTPVFELLKQRIPDVEVHVLCSKSNEQIAKHSPNVDKTYVLDKTFTSHLTVIRELRRQKFNVLLCYVLFKTTYAGLLANMISAKAEKITLLFEKRRELYSTFFTIQLPADRDVMTMAELQVLLLCNVFNWKHDIREVKLSLETPRESKEEIDKFLIDKNLREFVLINISAGKEFRRWSCDKIVEFVEALRARGMQHHLVLLSAPADTLDATYIAEKCSIDAVYSNDPNLMNVCELVSRSLIVVTPDTSIVHIASTFKKPVLGFYSYQTNYVQEWMPFNVDFEQCTTPNKEAIEFIPTSEAVEKFFALFNRTIQNAEG